MVASRRLQLVLTDQSGALQGVLDASPTESGNLLTPMLMGAVTGSRASGQIVSRSGRYKAVAVTGSVLVAIGMILLARMDAAVARW